MNEAPEEMLLGANLEEFAHRVSIIVSLESNNKITSADAYRQIKDLWRSVKKSKKSLGISVSGPEPPRDDDADRSFGI